jgi:hypothetical protein
LLAVHCNNWKNSMSMHSCISVSAAEERKCQELS